MKAHILHTGSPFRRRLSVALVLLLAFSLILLGSAIYRVATGVPDSYPDQQIRLLASGIGQTLLVMCMLALHHGRTTSAFVLMVPTAGAFIWSLSMM